MNAKKIIFQYTFIIPALLGLFLTSCGDNSTSVSTGKQDSTSVTTTSNTEKNQQPSDLKPAGEKPAWGKDITDPMAVVIEKLKSYGAPPLTTLSAQEARKQPSPADAAMAVMQEHNIPMPPNNVDTMGKDIPVKGGQIHARIYTPKTVKDAYPVIVYYPWWRMGYCRFKYL